jgi:FkbM family methyltransferase
VAVGVVVNPRREQAIRRCLERGETAAAVAADLNVAPSTVQSWLRDERQQRELKALNQQLKALNQTLKERDEALGTSSAKEDKLIRDHAELTRIFKIVGHDLAEVEREKLMSFLRNGTRPVIFDCGGHDGCSALLLKLMHPDYDCITFEPNPLFWHYYTDIDTMLVRHAVAHGNFMAEILIDTDDGDGSTIMADQKPVFFKKTIEENVNALSMPVACTDLGELLQVAYSCREKVALKLDIEGAEYDVLDAILAEKPELIAHLERFYCEFHGHKMLDKGRDYALLEASVRQVRDVDAWDAAPLAVHQKKKGNMLLRQYLVQAQKKRLDKSDTEL